MITDRLGVRLSPPLIVSLDIVGYFMSENADKQQEKKTGFALFPENINRAGRPKKGLTLTDLMAEYLERPVDGGDGVLTYKDAFVRKVFNLAMGEGDTTALKLIINYIDGMPAQKMDLAMDMVVSPMAEAIKSLRGEKTVEVTKDESTDISDVDIKPKAD